RRVSGATDALFLFSIIPKAGLEKSEDFSRPALFLETYVTASLLFQGYWRYLCATGQFFRTRFCHQAPLEFKTPM
ncbi:hypothetical protein, partial [Lactiplantibacillus paraplantarum]|uniref:hypothetical protein n=1 Tax=Lactiplantibacillus paraplantarum TaxID=60520 RepID=UPI0020748B02